MQLPFALWTRKAIQVLIKQRFGIQLPIRTVGEYLKRRGYTPRKPFKRAYEQKSQVVKEWVEEKYPEIKRRAQVETADIYWEDDTFCRGRIIEDEDTLPKEKLL